MPQIHTTLGDLLAAEPGLGRILGMKFDREHGAKVRYHAMKLATLLHAELKTFREAQLAIIKELGVEREPTEAERAQHGTSPLWEVAPEHVSSYRRQMADLCAQPMTLPWGPLTAAMLDPYLDLTPADLFALGPLYALDVDVKD